MPARQRELHYLRNEVRQKESENVPVRLPYRTESGELFACCAPTLEACRERRDKWLSSRQ